jgi:hypothetical protein
MICYFCENEEAVSKVFLHRLPKLTFKTASSTVFAFLYFPFGSTFLFLSVVFTIP